MSPKPRWRLSFVSWETERRFSFRDSCFVFSCGATGPRGGGDVEEYLPDTTGLHAFDVSVICPLLECTPMHTEYRLCLLGFDKFRAHATATTVVAVPRCVCSTVWVCFWVSGECASFALGPLYSLYTAVSGESVGFTLDVQEFFFPS